MEAKNQSVISFSQFKRQRMEAILEQINPLPGQLCRAIYWADVAKFSQGFFNQGNPLGMYAEPYKGNKVACEVNVKTSAIAGEIIGKAGRKIKQLMNKTSTKIQSPKKNDLPIFTITGTPNQVYDAKREILEMAEHFEKLRSKEKNEAHLPEGFVKRNVRVSGKHVGLVVGRNGKTIQRIKRDTHTEIRTPDKGALPIFVIEGLSCDVDRAAQLILKEVDEKTKSKLVHPLDYSATFSTKHMPPRTSSFLDITGDNSSFFSCQPNHQHISSPDPEQTANNWYEKTARPFYARSGEDQSGKFMHNEAFLSSLPSRYPSTTACISGFSFDSASHHIMLQHHQRRLVQTHPGRKC